MARHEGGQDGEERSVASRAARRGRGGGGQRRLVAGRRLRRSGNHATRGRSRPLCRASRAGRPGIRVLRRGLDPDSARRCRRAPASRTSSSATPRTRSTSGSSIWPVPSRFSSPAAAARTIAPNDTGDLSGVASYDQGEWSVIFKRPLRASSGAAFTPGGFLPIAFSVWDGFSRERGNRRGLTVWYSDLRRARSGPIARRPDGEDGAVHSRHRAGRDRLGAVASRVGRACSRACCVL